MIKEQLIGFIARWLLSSIGMWISITLFGSFTEPHNFWLFILAGLIFSLVNSVVKPLATIFALPLIVITLGLFTLIVNVAMVGLTIWLLPGVTMGFGGATLSSIVMSMINVLVNFYVPPYNKENKEQ